MISFFTRIIHLLKINPKHNENIWEPNIHPLYIGLKDKGTNYLIGQKGFNLFLEDRNRKIFINKDKIYISIINQGYDFPEVYIGFVSKHNDMIRLDFELEIYLNNNTDLIEDSRQISFYNFNYQEMFLDLQYNQLVDVCSRPNDYFEWRTDNADYIEIMRKKMVNKLELKGYK